jgi:uncharacterized phage-associated protein
MSRQITPVEESFAAWRKDPEYNRVYNALRTSSRSPRRQARGCGSHSIRCPRTEHLADMDLGYC